MDPRIFVINQRLKKIKKIIAVAGCKGGVGKSLVSSLLSLVLAKNNYKIGLLDLDFYSPSDHIILGIKNDLPKENKGLIPPKIFGIKFMSIFYYNQGKPTPFKGEDISNALIEMLTITRWGKLDFLIIDLPPGLGEATLDIIRFIKRVNFLIVAISSPLVLPATEKIIQMLKEVKVPILGIIENMKIRSPDKIKKLSTQYKIPLLAQIPFEKNLEKNLGKPDFLLKTLFSKEINKVIRRLFKK